MILKEERNFHNITKIRLSNTSIIRLFDILKDTEGNLFLNIFKSYGINSEYLKSDTIYDFYTMGPNDWWDNLAASYYENPQLWWIIPLINNIVNPFEGVPEGTIIKILSPKYIYAVLRDIDNLSAL